MAVIGVSQPPGRLVDRWAFWVLAAAASAAIPFGLWARSALEATIELSADGIRYVRRQHVTVIRWEEIQRVEYRRSSQRLKVFSSAQSINIERQVIGFEEIVEQIATHIGGAIAPVVIARPAIPENEITVAPPQWYRWFLLPVVAFAAYLFCIRWMVAGVRDASILSFVLGLGGGWLVWSASRSHWAQSKVRLTMDGVGIRFEDGHGQAGLTWLEIGTASMEYTDGLARFVVRDRGGAPVLQLRREMFNWTGSSLLRFDRLVEAATQRTRS